MTAKKSLSNLIKTHAHYGPLKIEEKAKQLSDGFFEYKAHEGPGYRLYYFVLDDGSVILTHGGRKPKDYAKDISKATSLRERYLRSQSQ